MPCEPEELEKVIKKHNKILVLFELDEEECSVCPLYAEMVNKLAGSLPVARVIIDKEDEKCLEIVEKYNLEEAPTLLFMKDGKEISRLIPTLDFDEDEKTLKDTISSFEKA